MVTSGEAVCERSEDAKHYREERNTDKTPTFEFDSNQSLDSRAAVEAFPKKTGTQLWIEHDLAVFNKQKKAPAPTTNSVSYGLLI